MARKHRIALRRIPALVAEARKMHVVTGPDDKGWWWVPGQRNGTTSGFKTFEEAQRKAEQQAAARLLNAVGPEGWWYDYDWHLWCHDAELMVREIVTRDREYQEAKANQPSWNVVLQAIISKG